MRCNGYKIIPDYYQLLYKNRVEEIREMKFSFRHISSGHNPVQAKSPFLGCEDFLPKKFKNYGIWREGSTWLKEKEITWRTGNPNSKKTMKMKEEKMLQNSYLRNNTY